MRIDLKALLLLSTSTPGGVILMNKRFLVGKTSFIIRYELRDGQLIIRKLKKLSGNLKKRQSPPQTKLEIGCTSVECSSQTSLILNSIAMITDNVIRGNNGSQTTLREFNSIQTDNSDLILTYTKHQQTINFENLSSGCQTEDVASHSRTTQAKIPAKTWSTQTKVISASLGCQTEVINSNAGVQSTVDTKQESTQTDEIEEQLIKPFLQEQIHESIQNMSHIIHNEVVDAVSSVLNIRSLDIRMMRQEQDLPREGSLEPLTPLSVYQIGEHVASKQLCSLTDIKDLLSKSALKFRQFKVKKFSAVHSWNCTMKCKSCGLHMHRSRLRLPNDSKSTQTKQMDEGEVNKEQRKTKVSVEMATQTEKLQKERGRWTLRRS